jgi:ABC-type uncharacterized transport system fused permease/ATPase subunit
MIFSGTVLNYMRSAAGQYASGEQELEGVFRHAVARLHEHAEQIASFGGGGREQSAIFTRLDVLLTHSVDFEDLPHQLPHLLGANSQTLCCLIRYT